MEKKIILHIPHASPNIPTLEGFIVEKEQLDKEIFKLTDWFTDDLFHSREDEMIIVGFSRIFCDPERFADDSQEIMSQFGMGVLYEKNDDGEKIRDVSTDLRNRVLDQYYWPHHSRLAKAVSAQLRYAGKAFILDCHSFPSVPFKRDLNKTENRPDFNIGKDKFHTPEKFVDLALDFFQGKGFTVGVDWPYQGSLVPLEYYMKDKNVQSMMLEINRALYLQEPTHVKSDNYQEIKRITGEFIKTLKDNI